jgi:hypothetical protein
MRAEEVASHAIGLLWRALGLGYFIIPGTLDHAARTDRDLDPLRHRRDFQLLLDAAFPNDPFAQPSPSDESGRDGGQAAQG